MIFRIALVALLVVVIAGVIGRWRRPRVASKAKGRAIEPARKCPECGVYVLAGAPGPCDRPDCAYR